MKLRHIRAGEHRKPDRTFFSGRENRQLMLMSPTGLPTENTPKDFRRVSRVHQKVLMISAGHKQKTPTAISIGVFFCSLPVRRNTWGFGAGEEQAFEKEMAMSNFSKARSPTKLEKNTSILFHSLSFVKCARRQLRQLKR